MLIMRLKALPLPLLPMILKSLNLATLFFITCELFLSSPQKFSSFPILRLTIVPSSMSLNAITLKAEGRVLFDLQWLGSAVQRMFGEPEQKELFKGLCSKGMLSKATPRNLLDLERGGVVGYPQSVLLFSEQIFERRGGIEQP